MRRGAPAGSGDTLRNTRSEPSRAVRAWAFALAGALTAHGAFADGATAGSLPQAGFFSSIKESLRLDPQHEVVRGHFDLGTPPNVHRYYCLVDTRTGRREPNGVLGRPTPRPDGTTGLKIDSVSLYGCDDAERQGLLVTAGYLPAMPARAAQGAGASPPAAVPAPPPASAPAASSARPADAAEAAARVPSAAIDVAGIDLGMSLAAARAVLKSKNLPGYHESTVTLSYWNSANGTMPAIRGGRFVNSIATWTAAGAGRGLEADGESYQVMFTPVPGRERVLAIVHSVGYAPARAVREVALDAGLVAKYHGFDGGSDLPEAPTWRFQRDGGVRTGDPCDRRALFGGLGGLAGADRPIENVALTRPVDEFRYEIGHCGSAIVTEDHYTANPGALPADRRVTRFTVTAYSPALALEGAESAAALIRAAKAALGATDGATPKAGTVPNL
jgi:hypothetical protein